ncbi:5'-nucleotidase C-terminal domain-containing protein [Aurantibacter sp.]|uniref:5'-nucleotidase C-terminal domain-containing protein n=1 Tax=Aurantibacter sp. TaxID=2807103 RepID=UPI0035C80AC9
MKPFLLPLILSVILFTSCKKNTFNLNEKQAQSIPVDKKLTVDKSIDSFIQPFRTHLNKTLDSALAFAPKTYSKKDYGTNKALNTAIGNFMADVVYTEAQPIFKSRTKLDLDAVLLNYGGIRSVISKGPISARTAYQVMPFENSIVITKLKRAQIDSLINYLATEGKAHPISNMSLTLDKNNSVLTTSINGKPLEDRAYYIATSDYLVTGGDRMNFFKAADTVYNTDYKIRNALIEHFNKADTITPKIDNRFIKLN